MEWTQEMKGAAMQDAAKVCELTDQLTAANKAIVALSEALEKCGAWNSRVPKILREQGNKALFDHDPAIEKARGG